MAEQVDVVVIGLGVGGEEAAGRLAQAGLSVVGLDPRLVGGECPYWGCIPSKMMIRAGNLIAETRRVDGMAGTATVEPDWAPVAKRIREEATDTWNDQVAVDRLVGKGVTFLREAGTITGPGKVSAGGREFEASRGIIVATGTVPAIPPIDGLAGTPYWTNHEAIEADTLPASIIVLGGGAIGLELAQVFARFGVAVTVVEAADRVLAMEEPESSDLAREVLEKDGITFRIGVSAKAVDHAGGSFTVTLDDGDSVSAEKLLVATGRRVNGEGLGLDAVGIDLSKRHIEVDEHVRAAGKVWAIGDVTGVGAFTHTAMYQANVAVFDILGSGDAPLASYHAMPRVTFTDPEIGAVGLTEKHAREQGLDVKTAMSQIPSSSRGWIHKAGNEGFIKLVVDNSRGVLVGATSAGPTGGEVLGALAVAVHAAVPVNSLQQMIYAYPTFHRAIGDALREL
ncbi:pyruvate/2-oxoglutarate dehydrogenase complex dihydrolipoamide dehydrogenase (E3) component [Kribbella sp. VKM Ac-2527]|uniref:Pyruvate/2-oxoglutarate dehydrogenase complex dihydrolipoamide dehydrogenase (E3) component n=1 Tax=Kribbella caucasensis TaxID=2512215 RepID=A0A4R6JF47_9ACTN|nr:NAD(P)/FAD-dependent oxidoreductase [Kribbella sp. VKM Ac-2527]TDO33236.1 pyruvate/2-oxoglutarate dehydrogenase complex dihydrolipoamide dehydrogenase (E3) component [Kribbella sp. VKM Ac-2527]